MPKVSDLFFKTAIVWLILGIGAGLQMAISGDHGAFPAHAHINRLGWVTSAIFGGYYALNPTKAARKVAMIHYGLYNVGLVVMLPALYLMLHDGYTAIECENAPNNDPRPSNAQVSDPSALFRIFEGSRQATPETP